MGVCIFGKWDLKHEQHAASRSHPTHQIESFGVIAGQLQRSLLSAMGAPLMLLLFRNLSNATFHIVEAKIEEAWSTQNRSKTTVTVGVEPEELRWKKVRFSTTHEYKLYKKGSPLMQTHVIDYFSRDFIS